MNSQRSPLYIASSSPHWTYEVFLSFRGEDTRKNFTDHLHAALERRGLLVFKDDKELEKGKSISPKLYKAIEESRMSIIVFSKNYASSTWCLDELVKILQCMKIKKQIVIPVFYDVDPSVIRKQMQNFQEAFAKHSEVCKENIEKVQNWRIALEEVANIAGWDLKDRHESKFIQDIVEHIAATLSPTTLSNLDSNLIGMDSRFEELMVLLANKEIDDISMIGIYGMGGIGKTTIARFIYRKISYQFEASSFLANVRENSKKNGLISLQRQLLSDILTQRDINIRDSYQELRNRLCNKKVLIVIDDVDDIEQLRELVGKHNWFGLGSRIIITTRNKHLLIAHGVDEIYKVEELDHNDALQLFSLKAFKYSQPLEEYVDLCKYYLKYARGHPLALNVLGSFLYGKTIDEWKSALQRLHEEPEEKIFNCLQISFNGLKEIEKKIFLDIACFFNGASKDRVTRILDGCDFNPTIGIRVLQDKCLLTIIDSNKLWIHDLLQDLGKKIVKKESPTDPRKRSRLWEEVDALNILTENMGTNYIEGIMLEKELQLSGNAKVFSKMAKLRLLKIRSEKLSKCLKYLPNELRLLEWEGYGLKSLPSCFPSDNIVELKMQHSCIEKLWNEIKLLYKLKVINLSHSKNLKKTPDFTNVPNLEELILKGCTRLHEIHPSLLVHKKLILLNLKECSSLRTLPSEFDMKSLKKLVLSRCLNLKNFPEVMPGMECLFELFLDTTSIKELPMSIKLLTGLVLLSLKDCKYLTSLPSLNDLKSLQTLNLSGSKLETKPENLGQVESLEELDIRGTAIRQEESNSWYPCFPVNMLPRKNSAPMTLTLPSLSGLCYLKRLELKHCNLREIPSDIGNIVSLKKLYLSGNHFVSLPASMNRLSKLGQLCLFNCQRLQSLPELPSNLWQIDLGCCTSLKTSSNVLKLSKLRFLYLENCCNLHYNSDFVAYPLIKEMSLGLEEFHRLIPGSEIPKWFRQQNDGSSIKIKNHEELKTKGYLVCALFSVHKFQPRLHKYRYNWMISNLAFHAMPVDEDAPDHLWLIYVPLDFNDEFEVKFYPLNNDGPQIEVKRCGVHPIYEEEVDQCGNFLSKNLIEYHQDFVAPAEMDVATTKRRLADTKEAEPSGDGDSEDDEPQPRKNSNFGTFYWLRRIGLSCFEYEQEKIIHLNHPSGVVYGRRRARV